MTLELSIETFSAGVNKHIGQSVLSTINRELISQIPGKPSHLINDDAVIAFMASAFVVWPAQAQAPAICTTNHRGDIAVWRPAGYGQHSLFVEKSLDIVKPALKGTRMSPADLHTQVDRVIHDEVMRFKNEPVQLATGIDWRVDVTERAATIVSPSNGTGSRDLVVRFPAVRPAKSNIDDKTSAKVWKDFQRFCPSAQPLLELMLHTRAAGSYCVMQQQYTEGAKHRASSRADVTLLDSEAHRFLILAIEQAGVAFNLTKAAHQDMRGKLTSAAKNHYLRSWVTIDQDALASDSLFNDKTYRPAELVLRWGANPERHRPGSIVIASPKLWLSQSRLIKAGMSREDYVAALAAYIGAFLTKGVDDITKDAGVWSDVAGHYADNAEWFARMMDKFSIPTDSVDVRVKRHTYQAWIEAMAVQAQAGRHRAIKALPGLSSSPEKLRLIRPVKPPANKAVMSWTPEQVALVCRLATKTGSKPAPTVRATYPDYDVYATTRLPDAFETLYPNDSNSHAFMTFADALELADSSLLPAWAIKVEHDSHGQPVAIRVHELCLASLLKCGELMAIELRQHEHRLCEIEEQYTATRCPVEAT